MLNIKRIEIFKLLNNHAHNGFICCESLIFVTFFLQNVLLLYICKPMRQSFYIVVFLLISVTTILGQGKSGRGARGGFSLSNLTSSPNEIPDSLLLADSLTLKERRITAYRLTPNIGDAYLAAMDTNRLNFGNSTLVEGKSLAVGYLANMGSPTQTKIFSERKEARDFIFADAYDYYITTPENAYYYDTKLPYTNVMYTQAGASLSREDQLKGVLTWNFGKKINVGAEADYIYSRGQYNSNGNKLLSYRLFGSYHSDKYELNAYLSNFNFINYENGGLSDDEYLTNPDKYIIGKQEVPPKNYGTRISNTWNRVRGKRYYLTHRYNLGFSRTLEETDEEGNPKEIFVPVSSIIHTLDYEDNRRRFTSNSNIDTAYVIPRDQYGNPLENYYDKEEGRRYLNYVYGIDDGTNDVTSSWNLKNTFALSLREGFQNWAKFGFTAFARFEKRKFKLPARVPGLEYDVINGSGPSPQPTTLDYPLSEIHDEFSTYLGAELSKRRGSILTYNARGEFCLVGDDLGEFRIDGELQTVFPLFGKDASIKAEGYIRNVTPAFYQRNHHSRYYWWDSETINLKKTQQFYVGGEVHLASTNTTLKAGVESIQNYIYFNRIGRPEQHGSNLQVITARLKQNLYYRGFGWENEAAYQLSSDDAVLPLPEISVYTNLYVHFKLAKVLTMQIGADMHYHTSYHAPYYEPATQQFRIQDQVKVGNYPLINGYVNFHLKQARFFVMGYNMGSFFLQPNYFSLAHYPVNPFILKMGISVVFNN